jgi:hypothetical protein
MSPSSMHTSAAIGSARFSSSHPSKATRSDDKANLPFLHLWQSKGQYRITRADMNHTYNQFWSRKEAYYAFPASMFVCELQQSYIRI